MVASCTAPLSSFLLLPPASTALNPGAYPAQLPPQQIPMLPSSRPVPGYRHRTDKVQPSWTFPEGQPGISLSHSLLLKS